VGKTTTSPPPKNDGSTTNSANGLWPLRECYSANRDFRVTVAARAARDPDFKKALLQEVLQAFLEGEVAARVFLQPSRDRLVIERQEENNAALHGAPGN
jgi:hypothetical protein